MSFKYSSLAALTLMLGLGACGRNADEAVPGTDAPRATEQSSPRQEASSPLDYAAFLTAETRPEADAADDAARKPAEVMAFMGAAAGWNVLEVEAGSGYYTELLSMAVGETGKVYMQNPAEFDEFLGDGLTNRLADGRLGNVEYLKSHFDAIPLDAESVDLITWILGPHELYFFPENKPEGFGDPATVFASLHNFLKPDGQLVMLDHAAAAGAPETTGGTTHRIDPAIVIGLAEAAGFVVDQQSDLLANPEDDYEKMVFDPSVRRKTDRFLISFKKAG